MFKSIFFFIEIQKENQNLLLLILKCIIIILNYHLYAITYH